MKITFSICLLFVFSNCLANCPTGLNGTWLGNYTDHGPFGRTMLIGLIINTHGKYLSGSSVNLPKQKIGLASMSLKGSCTNAGIHFKLSHSQEDPSTPPSTIRFINPNEIQVTLYWQTAMIGGHGQALLERQP